MKLADRATIANMAPEYGATMGFFPVDEQTLDYLRLTGRTRGRGATGRALHKEQQLFTARPTAIRPTRKSLTLDLGTVEPSWPGRSVRRTACRWPTSSSRFEQSLRAPVKERGFGLADAGHCPDGHGRTTTATVRTIGHGAVVIAAITSCTNTSNPAVMLAAGLLAKKAVERGLTVKPYVKTSLAPGSRVVTDYYRKTGLDAALEKLGFTLVGYGCTTCIGNSGPLPRAGGQGGERRQSRRRGRAQRQSQFRRPRQSAGEGQLPGQPAAGRGLRPGRHVDIDLATEPLGTGSDGQPVYLEGHLADARGSEAGRGRRDRGRHVPQAI